MSGSAKQLQDNYANLIEQPLRKNFDMKGISIFERTEPLAVIGEALSGNSQHILNSTHPHFVQDLNVAARMAQDCDAMTNVPLTTILTPALGGAKEKSLLFYERKFNQASQKSETLSQIDSTLSKRSIADSIRGDILLVADELFTNAIYNAPFVDLENTASGASRDITNVKMPGGNCAHLLLGGDSQRIVIGCKDNYGTLNFEKLLTRIKNCYERGVAATMRMSGQGGAGIGSFMIFHSAASIFYDVKMSSHTAVYCTLPVKMSSRDRMQIPKNLHFRIQNT